LRNVGSALPNHRLGGLLKYYGSAA
jgi:hypothetical protein